jgi:hypothetical protein
VDPGPGSRDTGSPVTWIGKKFGVRSTRRRPRRACRRQFHSKPLLTSCWRATAARQAPGCSHSATIRTFSSTRQRRRRSTPGIIHPPCAPPLAALLRTPLRSDTRVRRTRRFPPDAYIESAALRPSLPFPGQTGTAKSGHLFRCATNAELVPMAVVLGRLAASRRQTYRKMWWWQLRCPPPNGK